MGTNMMMNSEANAMTMATTLHLLGPTTAGRGVMYRLSTESLRSRARSVAMVAAGAC